MKRKSKHNRTGFTLVEILTTIVIIAILLGLLIPALTMVEKSAVKVKQKVQFHGIEISLETFSTDMGDYPPSSCSAAYGNYTASQRLAEAMVGRDGLGFHPDSKFLENGTDGTVLAPGNALYYPAFTPADAAERDANLAARKGPYLELENANAVMLSDLYGTGAVNLGNLVDSYVLADMYKITKNAATGKMTGSPILYYKANKGKIQHTESLAAPTDSGTNQCTYNVYDSIGDALNGLGGIVQRRPLSTNSGSHPIAGGMPADRQLFYNQTQNPNFSSPLRPYRSESFILQSAGPDSLYGTVDDVFNFDTDN